MVFVASAFAGLLVAAAYRLLRRRTIMPKLADEPLAAAWLKILAIIFSVTAGLWVALTLMERFPD